VHRLTHSIRFPLGIETAFLANKVPSSARSSMPSSSSTHRGRPGGSGSSSASVWSRSRAAGYEHETTRIHAPTPSRPPDRGETGHPRSDVPWIRNLWNRSLFRPCVSSWPG